jgi:general stress protein 26
MPEILFPASQHPDEHGLDAHRDRLVESFKRLTSGRYCGVMASVDTEHRPHARWMGAVCFHAPDSLLAITSPDSRKIGQLRRNAAVQWVFHDPERTEVLTLDGTAAIVEDLAHLKRLWNVFPDKSKAYFLQEDVHGLGFAIFQTQIESVEWIAPRQHLSLRVPFSSLAGFL